MCAYAYGTSDKQRFEESVDTTKRKVAPLRTKPYRAKQEIPSRHSLETDNDAEVPPSASMRKPQPDAKTRNADRWKGGR